MTPLGSCGVTVPHGNAQLVVCAGDGVLAGQCLVPFDLGCVVREVLGDEQLALVVSQWHEINPRHVDHLLVHTRAAPKRSEILRVGIQRLWMPKRSGASPSPTSSGPPTSACGGSAGPGYSVAAHEGLGDDSAGRVAAALADIADATGEDRRSVLLLGPDARTLAPLTVFVADEQLPDDQQEAFFWSSLALLPATTEIVETEHVGVGISAMRSARSIARSLRGAACSRWRTCSC